MFAECEGKEIILEEAKVGATCTVDNRQGTIVHTIKRSENAKWYDENVEHLFDAYNEYDYAAEVELDDGDFVYFFVKVN